MFADQFFASIRGRHPPLTCSSFALEEISAQRGRGDTRAHTPTTTCGIIRVGQVAPSKIRRVGSTTHACGHRLGVQEVYGI
jgi:hypothetical protein